MRPKELRKNFVKLSNFVMITNVNYKCDGYYINWIKLVNKLNLRNNQKKVLNKKGKSQRDNIKKKKTNSLQDS